MEKRITTRQFLRDFRTWKDQLLAGTVQRIVVEAGPDRALDLSVRRGANTASEIASRFAGLRRPLTVDRTSVVDVLLASRPRP